MLKPILLIAVASLALAGCVYDAPPPPPPPHQPPPMMQPPPQRPPMQPAQFTASGRIVEKIGACHTIRATNGTRYSVDAGELAGYPVNARIQFRAFVTGRQPCPNTTHINITSVRPL